MRALPTFLLVPVALAFAGCPDAGKELGRIGGTKALRREPVAESIDTSDKLVRELRRYEGVMRANLIEEAGHRQIEVLLGYKDPQDYTMGEPRVPAIFRLRVETETAAVLQKIFTAKVSDPPAAAWVTAICGWEDRRRKIRVPVTLIEISATREAADKADWTVPEPTPLLYKFQVMNYNRSVLVALKPPILLQQP